MSCFIFGFFFTIGVCFRNDDVRSGYPTTCAPRSHHNIQVLCTDNYFGLPLHTYRKRVATTRGTVERDDVRATGRYAKQKTVRDIFFSVATDMNSQ